VSEKKATFLATFPSIQTAIKVGGDGGMRIQLEIPESEMGNAAYILAMRQQVLKVTIELYDGFSNIHESDK
jgi:hypothetical protein